ncbi:GNAT family N-acetyltransferase, partial [Candidatus Riflebacteria bacterium]
MKDVEIALPWYQDMEVLHFTAGLDRKNPYDRAEVESMYKYLIGIGECYIIEVLENGTWKGIGDVTLAKDTIPIVIGIKEYWGRGIGYQVIKRLIERAKELDYPCLKTKEIYHFNENSKKLFASLGFRITEKTGSGVKMQLY